MCVLLFSSPTAIVTCPGGNARMAQFFRGNLAGLMIRSGKLENKKVIDCLYTCKEGLDVQLPEEVASAVKVSREQCFRDTKHTQPQSGWNSVYLFVEKMV